MLFSFYFHMKFSLLLIIFLHFSHWVSMMDALMPWWDA